jgi:hypothetical protein
MFKTETSGCSLHDRVDTLENLLGLLEKAATTTEKLKILNNQREVSNFLAQTKTLEHCLSTMSPGDLFIINSVLAIGQGPVVFHPINEMVSSSPRLKNLLQTLSELESSYVSIGGIIGYHLQVLKRIVEKQNQTTPIAPEDFTYHKPEGIDLSQNSDEVRRSIRWGIAAMAQIAEMYPVGGAGDRLNLKDDTTGEALPAAELLFGGRSLLEGLIRDLQSREYLH